MLGIPGIVIFFSKKQQEEASPYIDFPHSALDSIRFQDTMMVWAPTISRNPKAFPGPGPTERWKGGKNASFQTQRVWIFLT